MSLYDAAKDAIKVAQKADNIELVQKLLDVQQQALEMQARQQDLNKRIDELEKEKQDLVALKRLLFPPGRNYLIDPDSPERRLCPLCTKKFSTEVPLDNTYCRQCKGNYE